MIHHLLYYLDETDDRPVFNEIDGSHDMFAYLYSDRPNASFCRADSAKNGCGTPQLVTLRAETRDHDLGLGCYLGIILLLDPELTV